MPVRSVCLNIRLMSPVVISLWVLAAHFLRAGDVFVCLGLAVTPLLLCIKKSWAARTLQLALLGASLIWMQSTYQMLSTRLMMGDDWVRMFIIMVGVICFTLLSACVFLHPEWEKKYGLKPE